MFKQESVYGLPAKKKFGCCREVAASKYSTVLDVTTTTTKKTDKTSRLVGGRGIVSFICN